jgi:hypothetical protein
MTDEWQMEIAGRIATLTASLDMLRARKKEIPDPERRKTDAVTKEIEQLLKVIQQDKSKGVHNYTYATRLLSEAERKVLMVK